jgi:tetratricopeptide (TPR) repeat protein
MKPAVMCALLVGAMLVGSVINLAWPVITSQMNDRSFIERSWLNPKLSDDEQERVLKALIKEAEEKHFPDKVAVVPIDNYAAWLFSRGRYAESMPLSSDSAARSSKLDPGWSQWRASSMRRSALGQHYLFLHGHGKHPSVRAVKDIETALAIEKGAAKRDEQVIFETTEEIAEIYCDNKNYEQSQNYFNEAMAMARRQTGWNLADCLVGQARLLACKGKEKDADKTFEQAVHISDTTYGGGSDQSETIIRKFASGLKSAGLDKHSNQIAQKLDDVASIAYDY